MEETCNVEPFGASVGSAAAAKSSDRHTTPPSTDFGGVSVASKAASESIDVAASTSDSCGLSAGCETVSNSTAVRASSADSGRASADSASWDENYMEVMEVAANPDESVINCLKARVEAIQKGGKLGELSAFSAVSGADSAKGSVDHHHESIAHVQGSIDSRLQVAKPNLTGFRPIEGEPEPCPASPDSAEVAKHNIRWTFDGQW